MPCCNPAVLSLRPDNVVIAFGLPGTYGSAMHRFGNFRNSASYQRGVDMPSALNASLVRFLRDVPPENVAPALRLFGTINIKREEENDEFQETLAT
jgi:hypothetical protein